jgi:hypothetical protein
MRRVGQGASTLGATYGTRRHSFNAANIPQMKGTDHAGEEADEDQWDAFSAGSEAARSSKGVS